MVCGVMGGGHACEGAWHWGGASGVDAQSFHKELQMACYEQRTARESEVLLQFAALLVQLLLRCSRLGGTRRFILFTRFFVPVGLFLPGHYPGGRGTNRDNLVYQGFHFEAVQ